MPPRVAAPVELQFGRSAGAFLCLLMNRPKDPQPAVEPPSNELPRQLRRHDEAQPSAEDVREIKANLTGFFAVLREWSEKEKARPPPVYTHRCPHAL